MTDTKPSNQKAPTMTDYMSEARNALRSVLGNPNGHAIAQYARTLEALDTERAAHEATKAELQALREAVKHIRNYYGDGHRITELADQALTRKDA